MLMLSISKCDPGHQIKLDAWNSSSASKSQSNRNPELNFPIPHFQVLIISNLIKSRASDLHFYPHYVPVHMQQLFWYQHGHERSNCFSPNWIFRLKKTPWGRKSNLYIPRVNWFKPIDQVSLIEDSSSLGGRNNSSYKQLIYGIDLLQLEYVQICVWFKFFHTAEIPILTLRCPLHSSDFAVLTRKKNPQSLYRTSFKVSIQIQPKWPLKNQQDLTSYPLSWYLHSAMYGGPFLAPFSYVDRLCSQLPFAPCKDNIRVYGVS